MNQQQKERFAELSGKVIEWAEARNIIKGATPVSQFAKLISEFGEFGRNARKFADADGSYNFAKRDEIAAILKDDIGDQIVVMTIIAAQIGACVVQSVEHVEDSIHAPDAVALAMIGVYGAMADNVLKMQIGLFEEKVELAFRKLARVAHWLGTTLDECLAAAYDDIKDRKGVMYNGTFVKSTDAAYPGICAELGLEG